MLTSILIGLFCYSMLLTACLVGWHRHVVLIEKYDAAVEGMSKATPRIISAGVRPYPE